MKFLRLLGAKLTAGLRGRGGARRARKVATATRYGRYPLLKDNGYRTSLTTGSGATSILIPPSEGDKL